MSPDDKAAVVLIGICVGILAAYRALCWLLDRRIRARWQDRARQAAADVDAVRAARDLTECKAIWPDAPTRITNHPQPRKDQP